MKPTIYFLDDKSEKGQPKVIRGLAKKLFAHSSEMNLEIRPVDILGDLLMVVEHPTLNIGLLSHENKEQSIDDLIRFLLEEKCDVIFSTSIDKRAMDKSIARLVSFKKYQSVYLRNAFSSVIEIDSLTEHEVNKLFEMIELFLEFSNNTATSDDSFSEQLI